VKGGGKRESNCRIVCWELFIQNLAARHITMAKEGLKWTCQVTIRKLAKEGRKVATDEKIKVFMGLSGEKKLVESRRASIHWGLARRAGEGGG